MAGVSGFLIWATRLIPEAQNLGSFSSSGIDFLAVILFCASGARLPYTADTLTPTFSNIQKAAVQILMNMLLPYFSPAIHFKPSWAD